jgi:DHA1 family inner membrane transport protein
MAAIFWSFAAEAPRDAKTRRAGAGDVKRVLASRTMWLCNGLQFVRFSAATAFNFWLPTFLVADRGYTLVHAGLVVGLSAACAAAANPFGGYVSDRLRNPPLVIGGSLAVVACTSALLVTVESTPALLAVIGLNSIFMTVYFGPLFFVPVEALGQRTAGLTTGVGNLFANLGALVSAYALGFLKDATGDFAAGFYALSALCAVGVVLSVVLARLRTAHRSGRGSLVTATRAM